MNHPVHQKNTQNRDHCSCQPRVFIFCHIFLPHDIQDAAKHAIGIDSHKRQNIISIISLFSRKTVQNYRSTCNGNHQHHTISGKGPLAEQSCDPRQQQIIDHFHLYRPQHTVKRGGYISVRPVWCNAKYMCHNIFAQCPHIPIFMPR